MLDHPGTDQIFTLELYITLFYCHRYRVTKLVAVPLIPEAARHQLEFHLDCASTGISPCLHLNWNFTLPAPQLEFHLACASTGISPCLHLDYNFIQPA
jgi:hypothetical protein